MSRENQVLLSGLDGSNPLGFLAAVGTLRSLSLTWSGRHPALSWLRHGCWRPVLHTQHPTSEAELVHALTDSLTGGDRRPELNDLGNDLTIEPGRFRVFADGVGKAANSQDRCSADFVAAFASESHVAQTGRIQDTAFRTMAGAGHQHFLAFMRNIIQYTTSEHLYRALFESWRYDDPVQNATLRWDPVDDVRYALRDRNPSGDPVRTNSGSVLGANRLAIEGLPLFPTTPDATRLETTGFRGQKASNTFWTWPIWTRPASVEVVRSLLSLRELQCEAPDRDSLRPRGISEVFRAQRLTVGKVRNFTPARAV